MGKNENVDFGAPEISHGETSVERSEASLDTENSIEYDAGTGDAQMAALANETPPGEIPEQGYPDDAESEVDYVGGGDDDFGDFTENPVAHQTEEGLADQLADSHDSKPTEPDAQPVAEEHVDDIGIPVSKKRKDPTPTSAKRKEFNPNETQDPRTSKLREGGVMASASGMSMKSNGNAAADGYKIKAPPNIEVDSIPKKFEVTGFRVEYNRGEDSHVIEIRDYFQDEISAKASINGDRYLMPLSDGGFMVSRITQGAPIICLNERQLFHYKDEEWVRS